MGKYPLRDSHKLPKITSPLYTSINKSTKKRDVAGYVSTCYLYYVICTLNYTPKEARTASTLAVASASQRA